VVLHKNNIRGRSVSAAFTLVEAVVAISLVGLGITSAVAALTKFNAFASSSRNSTGAYAAVMNQIDAIETAAPFNPANNQIPEELTLDANRPSGLPKSETVRVYLYKDPVDPTSEVRVVDGTLKTSVEIDPTANGVTLYRATVTVDYTYLNRSYKFSMSTLRASD
jgi:type II secretory pathway pseudopilin PulG